MDELNKRVIRIMETFSSGKSAFAQTLGVGLPVLTHITSGRNKPGVDLLQKIVLTYKRVDAEWLLTGNGNMTKSEIEQPDIESELLELNRLQAVLQQSAKHLSQVLAHHKIIQDEIQYITELDNNIVSNQNNLVFSGNKMEQIAKAIKSKLNK